MQAVSVQKNNFPHKTRYRCSKNRYECVFLWLEGTLAHVVALCMTNTMLTINIDKLRKKMTVVRKGVASN